METYNQLTFWKIEKPMKTYTVDCSWEMYGHIEIEANSLEEAIQIAESEQTKLSDVTADYVSGSFVVDYDTTYDQNGEGR